MFKKFIILITLTAFIIFTLSCGSTKHLTLDKISEWEGENIENVYVEKSTGESIWFYNASIRENMISGKAVENGDVMIEEMSIPLEEAKGIEFSKKNRSKGAEVGFLTGLLVGGTIGRLLVCNLWGDILSLGNDEDALQGMLYGTGIGGGIGGIIGATIGANVGVSDNYILSAPADSNLKEMDIKGKVAIISDKTGDVIDLEERSKYNLFSGIEGFQSAVLITLPDRGYVFEITTLDETTGEENIEQMIRTESQIMEIRDYIEQFE